MIDDIAAARDAALEKIAAASTVEEIVALDSQLLGKRGDLAQLKTRLGGLATVDERRTTGQRLNEAVEAVAAAIASRREALTGAEIARRVEAERLDLSEFAGRPRRGHAHLVTQAWERLEDVFIGLGFQVAEGPEVETDWYNFGALNMGEDHPARSDFDTLFVDHAGAEQGRTVLRTHTSPVQIRAMLASEPPLYIVAPGRCFRRRHPRRHPHAGVPPDRRARRRPRHHPRRPRRHDRGVHPGVLRRRASRRACGRATSRSPSRRASSTSGRRAASGSSSAGAAWSTPTCCGRAGSIPTEWSGFAFGFGIDRMADAAPRRRRHPGDVHRRHPLRGAVLMKILLSWLRDYVDTGDDLAALSDTLTMLGLAVEGVERSGGIDGIVTARVVRTEAPPEAAKVQRVWVDDGRRSRAARVVRRVQLRAGDIVPLAPLGTTMPDGRDDQPPRRSSASTPRGCSARRASSASATITAGSSSCRRTLRWACRTATRSGCAAMPCSTSTSLATGPTAGRTSVWRATSPPRPERPSRRPRHPRSKATGDERIAAVEIVDGDRCGRFTSTVLSGVRVGPSAGWMAERLTAAGMRPINNVVDVSNYVMLELGQPNHAYDLATLGGGGFRIRTARDGETLTTLDGVERRAHRRRPADLRRRRPADRLGGDHGRRRHRDQRHDHRRRPGDGVVRARRGRPVGVPSRAALRGVGPVRAGRRSVRHRHRHRPLRRNCSARPAPSSSCTPGRGRPRRVAPPAERSCAVRVERGQPHPRHPTDRRPISRRSSTRSASPSAATGDAATVRIPSWRPDSAEEIDVIEEVARLYGYDRIGKRLPASPRHGHLTVPQQRRRLLRQVLLGLGHHGGHAEPVPRAGHARPRRHRRRRPADHQSARRRGGRAAAVATARAARRGRVQRVASPSRGGAVRDRPRLPARAR